MNRLKVQIPSAVLLFNEHLESGALVTRKQRFEKLLRGVLEGHEEFLGATPD